MCSGSTSIPPGVERPMLPTPGQPDPRDSGTVACLGCFSQAVCKMVDREMRAMDSSAALLPSVGRGSEALLLAALIFCS